MDKFFVGRFVGQIVGRFCHRSILIFGRAREWQAASEMHEQKISYWKIRDRPLLALWCYRSFRPCLAGAWSKTTLTRSDYRRLLAGAPPVPSVGPIGGGSRS